MTVKKCCVIIICIISLCFVCGCGNDDSGLLLYYTRDLRYNASYENFFLPWDVFTNYNTAFRSFNQNTEYNREVLRTLSAGYIRRELREVYSMQLESDFMAMLVQFPNRKIYERYLKKFAVNPIVSRDDFAQFIRRYEYIITIRGRGDAIKSKNYIELFLDTIEYIGKPYMPLNIDDAKYFLSDEFKTDMSVIARWVRKKKWKDLNSVMIAQDNVYAIYTFDPSNKLPVINNIRKVTPSASEPNTYITKTGNHTVDFEHDGAELETIENKDGSIDVLYTAGGEFVYGIRIFLSGASTKIDAARRIIAESS